VTTSSAPSFITSSVRAPFSSSSETGSAGLPFGANSNETPPEPGPAGEGHQEEHHGAGLGRGHAGLLLPRDENHAPVGDTLEFLVHPGEPVDPPLEVQSWPSGRRHSLLVWHCEGLRHSSFLGVFEPALGRHGGLGGLIQKNKSPAIQQTRPSAISH